MKTKHIALSFGALTAVAAPVVAVVSCGKKANKDLDVIKLDFSSDAKSVLAAKTFYDQIYKAGQSANEYKKYELDLTLPMGQYTVDLAPNEFADVQQGKIDAKSSEMSLADFCNTMKTVTGSTHQYSYAKGDAVKLGVDGNSPDHDFQVQWLTTHLIGTMPTDVSIKEIKAGGSGGGLIGNIFEKLNNNLTVTFNDASGNKGSVEFHLKSAKNQVEADANNAKGGSMFYKAFKAIEEPVQKVIGELKTIAHYGKANNNITEKQLFTDVAKTVADAFVEKMGSMIPVYGEIINLPIIGGKVSGFVESHTVEPLIDFVSNKL